MNQRQMERMAKKMGMQMENIDAEEVIIRGTNTDIVISNPHVSRVNVMGQDTFQVTGDISEKSRESYTAEDVEMVKQQTGCTEEDAIEALKKANGDLAEAIMSVKESKA
ncbi:MAG: nascent polypeptide-associated complex protein [Nanoarchaeota archaeon]|nr:nascent polypeptide-associated complex protein [Nanoarchaeota archaeon]